VRSNMALHASPERAPRVRPRTPVLLHETGMAGHGPLAIHDREVSLSVRKESPRVRLINRLLDSQVLKAAYAKSAGQDFGRDFAARAKPVAPQAAAGVTPVKSSRVASVCGSSALVQNEHGGELAAFRAVVHAERCPAVRERALSRRSAVEWQVRRRSSCTAARKAGQLASSPRSDVRHGRARAAGGCGWTPWCLA